MNRTWIVFLIVSGLTGSTPALAHHAFQAEYDRNKPLTLVGKLTRVVTENPHGWIYLDTKNDQGKIVNWALEIPAPNVVVRNGFDKSIYQTIVSSGEQVTVIAFASKDGSKHAWAQSLTRADGTEISLSGTPPGGRAGRGTPPPR